MPCRDEELFFFGGVPRITSPWLSALLQMKSIKGSVRNYKRGEGPAQKSRRTSVSMQN